jgi:hypothetical protein
MEVQQEVRAPARNGELKAGAVARGVIAADDPVPPPRPPLDCGTKGTPPCPPPGVLIDLRANVIDTLAGAETTTERRNAITAVVDSFLSTVLDGVMSILTDAQVRYAPVDTTVQIAYDATGPRIVVGEGAKPETIAAAISAIGASGGKPAEPRA